MIERWATDPNAEETCFGCFFLDGAVFPAGEGPRPRLHEGCRRERVPVAWRSATAGLSPTGKIALWVGAKRNAAQGAAIREEAERRWREEPDPREIPVTRIGDIWRSA